MLLPDAVPVQLTDSGIGWVIEAFPAKWLPLKLSSTIWAEVLVALTVPVSLPPALLKLTV